METAEDLALGSVEMMCAGLINWWEAKDEEKGIAIVKFAEHTFAAESRNASRKATWNKLGSERTILQWHIFMV